MHSFECPAHGTFFKVGHAPQLLPDPPCTLHQRKRKRDRSKDERPFATRSATTSPMAAENLKPWPEHGLTSRTCECAGWRSIRKWVSGVLVYMQTTDSRQGPVSAGRKEATRCCMQSISDCETLRLILSGSTVWPS